MLFYKIGRLAAAALAAAAMLLFKLPAAQGAVSYANDTTTVRVTNGRLTFQVAKTGSVGHDVGSIYSLTLDGQELLGNGGEGYFDMHDVAGYFRLGHHDTAATTYEVRQATDASGVGYVDMVVHHSPSSLEPLDVKQHYVLRDGETGIHLFTEVNHSASQKDDGFGEMRSVIHGDEKIFTYLSTEDTLSAPLPLGADLNAQDTVQDTTWDLGAYPHDPYVAATGKRYYTKYDFSGFEIDHTVHGFWGPTGYGMWLVQVNRETLTGGPTRYDLMEHHGPSLLNMLISGHYGSKTPNMAGEWHRTYGPFLLYLNKAATLAASRADAKKYATPSYDRAFYDTLAIPGYAVSAQRGTVTGSIVTLQGGSAAARQSTNSEASTEGAVAVLDSPGIDFQRAIRPDSFQYWTRITPDGTFAFDHVRAGSYRLTVYKAGIFGEYDNDAVLVTAGETTRLGMLTWKPVSHGREVWRIGTPDRTAMEFRHGNEYRYYWGGYNFNSDFPGGVHYVVGQSAPSKDWNYTQWGAFPPFSKTAPHASDWDVQFTLPNAPGASSTATLTVTLASIINGKHDPKLTVAVNGYEKNQLMDWLIPAADNGQSAIRSGILSLYLDHVFAFPATLLHAGTNHLYFHVPDTGENLQYDALRLEIN